MTTQQLYQKVINEQMTKSEFLWNVRRDNTFNDIVTNVMSYDDTISVLKSKGYIWDSAKEEEAVKSFDFIGTMRSLNEAKGEPKAKEMRDKADRVIYQELMKGWKWELTKTDDVDKAKEKALANLAKDSLYYTKMEMKDFVDEKELANRDMQVVKKGSEKDPYQQMKPAKGKKEQSKIDGAENKSKTMEGEPEYVQKKSSKKTIKEAEEASSDKNPYLVTKKVTNVGLYSADRPTTKTQKVYLTKAQADAIQNQIDKGSVIFSKIEPAEEIEKPSVKSEPKQEPKTSKEEPKDKKPKFKYKASKPKGELFRYRITYPNGKTNDVSMTPEEAEREEKKGNKIEKISNIASDKFRQVKTTYAPGVVPKSPSKEKPETTKTKSVTPEPSVSPNEKKWYAVDVKDTKNPKIVAASDDKEKIKKVKGNDVRILVVPVLGLKKAGLSASSQEFGITESLDKDTKKELESSKIAFVIPGDEDPNEKVNVTDTVKAASYDKSKKRLNIDLSGGGQLTFSKGTSGTPVGVYFTSVEGQTKSYKILDVLQPLNTAIDKVFKDKEEQPYVDEALESYIRKRIREAIYGGAEDNNDYGQYNGMIGPDPLKKKLKEYMARYQWGWQDSTDPAERDRGQEVHGIVTKMVTSLGEEGIKIYNSYAPKGFEIKSIDDLGKEGDFQVGLGPQDRQKTFYPDQLTTRSGMFENVDNMNDEEIIGLAKDVLKDVKKYSDTDASELSKAFTKFIQNKGVENVRNNKEWYSVVKAAHALSDENIKRGKK